MLLTPNLERHTVERARVNVELHEYSGVLCKRVEENMFVLKEW